MDRPIVELEIPIRTGLWFFKYILSTALEIAGMSNYGSVGADHELLGHSPTAMLHFSDDDRKEDTFLLQRAHSIEVVNNHFSSVVFNTATALLGASMFSLPWAFQQSGVVGGSVVLFLVAIVAGETARMLLVAQRAIFERSGKILRYPEIASEILGNENWGHFVRTATIISCVGGCCGYMIFLGQVVIITPENSRTFLIYWIRSLSFCRYLSSCCPFPMRLPCMDWPFR